MEWEKIFVIHVMKIYKEFPQINKDNSIKKVSKRLEQFTREVIQIVKEMKRSSISLLSRKIEIKMRCCYTFTRMTKIKEINNSQY